MHRSVDLIAIDIPDTERLDLPEWRTSQLLTGQFARLRPWSDLSAKRNLGLDAQPAARLVASDVPGRRHHRAQPGRRSARERPARHAQAVGLHVCGFHDHSVVCHAYRDAGGRQQSFIGGGALVVQVDRTRSFFPEVYNDDWFYLLDGDKGILPSPSRAGSSSIRTIRSAVPNGPAARSSATCSRKASTGCSTRECPWSAPTGNWTAFLRKRKAFILRVLDMVAADRLARHKPSGRDGWTRCAARSAGSLGSCPSCAWSTCRRGSATRRPGDGISRCWRRALARADALAMLARPGARLLAYQIGGRNAGPALVADPSDTARAAHYRGTRLVPRPCRQPRALGPQPTRQRQFSRVGAEASCTIGLV